MWVCEKTCEDSHTLRALWQNALRQIFLHDKLKTWDKARVTAWFEGGGEDLPASEADKGKVAGEGQSESATAAAARVQFSNAALSAKSMAFSEGMEYTISFSCVSVRRAPLETSTPSA